MSGSMPTTRMNRRNFLGTLAKTVAVATVAPTVIASALNTPAPVLSVPPLKPMMGAASGGMDFVEMTYRGHKYLYAKGLDDTAERFCLQQELQLLVGGGKTDPPFKDMGFMIPMGKI